MTSVEHFVARSAEKELSEVYKNCLYACRLCNGARSNRPLRQGEAQLLDPTTEAWADHFTLVGDRLVPNAGDADAAYTQKAYDLNEARRVERRERRRWLLDDRLELLRRLNAELVQVQDRAMKLRRKNRKRFIKIWITIGKIREDARRALEILEMYRAIPRDAPQTCRCESQENHHLPEELERQTLEISVF